MTRRHLTETQFTIERILPREWTAEELAEATGGLVRVETISLEEFKRRYAPRPDPAGPAPR